MSRAARVGAFIVATLAILVLGVFIIGGRQYLFSSTYQLKAEFDNVVGLDAGGDVRVGGVHSGTVHNIVLPHKPGEKVTVIMDLRSSTHEIIKQDSVATIQTEGLLGNQYLAISFGSAGKAEVRDGDTIASQPPLEMSDLFKKTNNILDTSQQAIQNATQATAHLDSISAKIDHGQGTVGALVNDKQLYNNLAQTSSAMHETVIQAQAGATGFQENMEALKHNFLLRGYFKNRGYTDASELEKYEIVSLPTTATLKDFTFQARQIFDKQESAKLKNSGALDAAGEFLVKNNFGVAVIVVSTGMTGNTDSDLVLSQARAMVVRDYLVGHHGFDDTKLKTVALGKQNNPHSEGDWGLIRILIYPADTPVPAAKTSPKVSAQDPLQNLEETVSEPQSK